MIDTHDLNQRYLLGLHSAAKSDIADAITRFGCDQSFAKAVADLSITDLIQAAKTDRLLFRPAVTGELLKNLLVLDNAGEREMLATLGATTEP